MLLKVCAQVSPTRPIERVFIFLQSFEVMFHDRLTLLTCNSSCAFANAICVLTSSIIWPFLALSICPAPPDDPKEFMSMMIILKFCTYRLDSTTQLI